MAFKNYVVPNNALLGKYVQVEKNTGKFKIIGDLKIMYSSMMFIRKNGIGLSAQVLAAASLIALRYSNVRRQFEVEGKERLIIDYQLQKSKIYPLIAKAYAILFFSKKVCGVVDENDMRINKHQDFSLMKELHILLCIGKVLLTPWTNDGVLKAINACGGHGFLVSSGFAGLLNGNFANVIMEGENTVLLLQIARELLKSFNLVTNDNPKKLLDQFKYFQDMEVLSEYKTPTEKEEYFKISTYVKAFRKGAIFITQRSAAKLMTAISEQNLAPNEAFNHKASFLVTKAAKLHAMQYFITAFEEYIQKFSGAIKNAMQNLCILFSVDQILEYANFLVMAEVFDSEQLKILRDVYEELLEKVHVDSLVLLEGFSYPDIFLQSTIGHSNGKVYENLLAMAKTHSTLNRMPNVHPAILEIIPQRNRNILKHSSLAKL